MSANDKADAAWDDYVNQQQEEKIEELERELNAANERIKRLEEVLTWYETKVSDCNRHGPEGDAARYALAKDYGRKAKEAKLCRYCLRSDCECSDSDVMPDIGDK